MAQSRATIRDVAALAGVSHQTVSRVINDGERVRPATRQRVETAIAELDFRPNAIARFMATGSTHTFTCLAPNLTDYTFARIIEGAEHETRRQGYYLFSASAADEDIFATLVDQLVSSRRTEGLLVINPYADSRHRHLPDNVPTVYVGARPREEAVDSVALDDEGAAVAATEHLLALGHRRIGMVCGPMSEDCSQDRLAGYQAALTAAGQPIDPCLIDEGDWSATSGYQAFQRLAQLPEPPTAVFAQNDRMAIGVLRALREVGLRVPAELAVIGFDDMPLASYFDPSLTTMRQDLVEIGRQAAQLLIRAVENPNAQRQHLRLPAELIIRESTGVALQASDRSLAYPLNRRARV
ncbi:MAG TPA: LacI family DNA-binding transcriptional regulator, partial [Anaerolineae bacterium]|nr:LacI family DNA-binding transcriptional regulator [Anaerolineae bacterium]